MKNFAGAAMVFALLGAGPLSAQQEAGKPELPAPVRSFVDRMYSPQRDGLKDLSVVIDTPLNRGNKLFQHIKVVVFVRTPDRHCLDIQGLPDETRRFWLQQLKPLSTLTRYLFCLGAIMEKVLLGSDLSISLDGELHRIEATPRSEELLREFRSLVLWVDDQGRPVRLDQDSPELGTISVRVKTEEKEGKALLSELRVSGLKDVKGDLAARIAYEKVGAFWFPSTVSMSKAEGAKPAAEGKRPEESFLLKDFKVNEGVDEEVFRKVEAFAAAERKTRAKADLQAIRKALEAYREAAGAYPGSLGDLAKPPVAGKPPVFSSELPKDPWGRDYNYRRTDEGYRLLFLGADGKEGGEGENADLE